MWNLTYLYHKAILLFGQNCLVHHLNRDWWNMQSFITYINSVLSLMSHTLNASCMQSPYWCHRFASQLVEIHVNVYKRPLIIFKRPLVTLWQTFIVEHDFFSSARQPFFSGVLISPIVPKAMLHIGAAHVQLRAIAVYKLPSQTKVTIMPAHIWREILECHNVLSKNHTSYLVAKKASIEDDHIKRRPCPSS